ncbi:BQ2448_4745 [Microbotryum intermedium]|uniref:BQ2448_4745 protein n=1 Tax=Microbotryum intermedium TaxID=269621 RepID=A0A238FIS0_9BASI|nr:BQ2448_4745 [Microbotryum intermedium]
MRRIRCYGIEPRLADRCRGGGYDRGARRPGSSFPNLSFPLERHQVVTNEARACLPCIKARNPDLARRIHRREGLVADDQAHKFERYHHPLVACLGANLDGPSGMLDQAVSVVLLMRHGTLSNRQLTPVPGHLEQGRCCFRDAGAMKRALAHGAFSVIVCLARAPQIKGDRFKTSPRPGPTPGHIVATINLPQVGTAQPLDSMTHELLEQPHSKVVNAQEAHCRQMELNGAAAPIWLYGIRGSLPDQPTVIYLEIIGFAMLLHCRIAQHRAHHVVLPADVTSRTPHSATSIASRLGEALQGLGFVSTFDHVDEPLVIKSVPPLQHYLKWS